MANKIKQDKYPINMQLNIIRDNINIKYVAYNKPYVQGETNDSIKICES